MLLLKTTGRIGIKIQNAHNYSLPSIAACFNTHIAMTSLSATVNIKNQGIGHETSRVL
jgi:hypothetical protein